jgi:hypothetical protein
LSGKSKLKRRRTTRGVEAGGEDKLDVIRLTLLGETSHEREEVERKRREFGEGGPRILESPGAEAEEVDSDDSLTDSQTKPKGIYNEND